MKAPLAFLQLFLRKEDRSEILGDLQEAHALRRKEVGSTAAAFWLWRQACSIAVKLTADRIQQRGGHRGDHHGDHGDIRPASTGSRAAILEEGFRDLRFGLRGLRGRPVFALTAVLTLAVGAGMTTTMFALVDAIMLRPLPGDNSRGVVYLGVESEDGRASASPTPELLRLVDEHSAAFSRVEAYSIRRYSVAVDGEPTRIRGAQASSGFFSFLGVGTQRGRGFVADDGPGSENLVVVLSHTFWNERFAGSEDVVGRAMVIDGEAREIVGVLPREFRLHTYAEPLFWIPGGRGAGSLADGDPVEGALARLADGVSLEAARAEIDAIVQNNPLTPRADMTWVGTVSTPADLLDPSLRKTIVVLQFAAILVLLIACGNLANLLLAQGAARSRELAVKAALGASRWRLARQLLVECGILGALGAMGGLLLAFWGLRSLPIFLPPGYAGFSLSPEVLVASLGVSLGGTLVAGLLPAFRASRRNLTAPINGATRGDLTLPRRASVPRLLVVLEVGMALVLLLSAGLLVKSFAGLITGDVGFAREDLLAVRLELPASEYPQEESRLAFLGQLRDELRARFPERLGAATVATGLVEGIAASVDSLATGSSPREDDDQLLIVWGVAHDYFEVVGVPLIEGPGFAEGMDTEAERDVIVNDTLARRYFPDGFAVGQQLRIGDEWHRVAAVAGSVKLPAMAQNTLDDLQLFVPLHRNVGNDFQILARIRGERGVAVDRLKEAVWSVDRSLPILDIVEVEDALADSLGRERSNALLMALYAMTALTLSAVGIYGVVAQSVGQQVREIGIRIALGATPEGEVTRVVGRGMATVGCGVLLGALGFAALGPILSELLHGVSSRDPLVLAAGASLVVGVTLIATWLPARQAAAEDLVSSLRGG